MICHRQEDLSRTFQAKREALPARQRERETGEEWSESLDASGAQRPYLSRP